MPLGAGRRPPERGSTPAGCRVRASSSSASNATAVAAAADRGAGRLGYDTRADALQVTAAGWKRPRKRSESGWLADETLSLWQPFATRRSATGVSFVGGEATVTVPADHGLGRPQPADSARGGRGGACRPRAATGPRVW
jgi:hypothetical protein